MSTKIYNGYRLNGVAPTLASIRDFCDKIREPVTHAAKTLQNMFCADVATRVIDLHATCRLYNGSFKEVLGEDAAARPTTTAFRSMIERQKEIKRNQSRDPAVDFEFELCFFDAEGETLCILYAERKELHEIFRSFPEVVDYGYWSNTEQPEDVTDEEWKERGKLWNKTLGKNGVPGEHGFTQTIVGQYTLGYSTNEDILSRIPDVHARAEALAREELLDGQLQKYVEEVGPDAKLQSHEYLNLFSKANDWLKTNVGEETLKERTAGIAAMLRNPVTIEDLQEKYPLIESPKTPSP